MNSEGFIGLRFMVAQGFVVALLWHGDGGWWVGGDVISIIIVCLCMSRFDVEYDGVFEFMHSSLVCAFVYIP